MPIAFVFMLLIITCVPVWSQRIGVEVIGGYGEETLNAIVATSDGGVIAAVNTKSNDGDFKGSVRQGIDFVLVKFDKLGNVAWQRQFKGREDDVSHGMALTADTCILITGRSYSDDGDFQRDSADTNKYIFTFKLDQFGNIVWRRYIGGQNDEQGCSVSPYVDNGCIVAGWTSAHDGDFRGLRRGEIDCAVMRLDSSGGVKWITTIGGSQVDRAFSTITTSSGNIFVSGITRSNDMSFAGMGKGGREDAFVANIDSSGSILWKRVLGGTGGDWANGMAQLADGGIAIVGSSDSHDGDSLARYMGTDIVIVKMDSLGQILWKKAIGGTGNESANAVVPTNDGGMIVTGESQSRDGDLYRLNRNYGGVFIFKLDSVGNFVWKKRWGGTSGVNTEVRCLSKSYNGSLHIGGSTNEWNGDFKGLTKGAADAFVMTVDSLGILNNITSLEEYADSNDRLSVAPMPFFTSTIVFADVAESKNARIELLDLMGQVTAVIYEGYINAGTHSFPLDGSSMSAGLYSIRLISGSGCSYTMLRLAR